MARTAPAPAPQTRLHPRVVARLLRLLSQKVKLAPARPRRVRQAAHLARNRVRHRRVRRHAAPRPRRRNRRRRHVLDERLRWMHHRLANPAMRLGLGLGQHGRVGAPMSVPTGGRERRGDLSRTASGDAAVDGGDRARVSEGLQAGARETSRVCRVGV
jgi:hypothetical protein